MSKLNLHPLQTFVSVGNSKIGDASNVSLLPIVTCGRAPCAGTCYACKLLRLRPNTRTLWGHNTRLIYRNPDAFFKSIAGHLLHRPEDRFRFWVGGDFPTFATFGRAFDLAAQFPNTRFLAFTKRYRWAAKVLDSRPLPANFSLILSAWPNWPLINPHRLPVAWLDNPKEPDARIPRDAKRCPGNCETCNSFCWQERADVVFTTRRKKHPEA